MSESQPQPTLRSDARLAKVLLQPEVRAELVAALAALIEREVRTARGLRGAAVRSAFATLERMKRGAVPILVDQLLDGWVGRLERHYALFVVGGRHESFGDYVSAHRDAIATLMMEVAGERAERSGNKLARGLFRSLSASAERSVRDVVPHLGAMVDGYLTA